MAGTCDRQDKIFYNLDGDSSRNALAQLQGVPGSAAMIEECNFSSSNSGFTGNAASDAQRDLSCAKRRACGFEGKQPCIARQESGTACLGSQTSYASH